MYLHNVHLQNMEIRQLVVEYVHLDGFSSTGPDNPASVLEGASSGSSYVPTAVLTATPSVAQ